jgi:hydroxymethylglutaryl-CoA lyase
MIHYPEIVIIEEQGLRDGLQNEIKSVPTANKIEIINALVAAGVQRIQVTAFVNPSRVSQMADADKLCVGLQGKDGAIYSALILNLEGVERAAAAGLKHVTASISASNTHSRKNTGMGLAEARKKFAEMAKTGKKFGLTIRGGLQCVFGCRFEGKVEPDLIIDMVKEQLDSGVDEIELADSTGMAHPRSVQNICSRVLTEAKTKPVYLHLHDTEGKGLANVLAAMQIGITHFDTAFGGMGGCPFIKGATGNIATEDLVFMLDQMGIETGIDVEKIAVISRKLEAFLGKQFAGKMHQLLKDKTTKIVGCT